MAKTSLNKKVDAFFKKYKDVHITEEIVDKSGLDIKEVNEYGSLLHAIVNYDYDVNRIQELFRILLKKGIDVNYKGKETGLTFIHLALYGYTKEDGRDYSYDDIFITNLIKEARKYGLNVNIKDNDNEDIPTCAVASEIYKFTVLKVILALGEDYELPDNFLDTYQKYLNESKKVSKEWYERLKQELPQITEYVKKKNLSLSDINESLNTSFSLLNNYLKDITYDDLKTKYKNIKSTIEKIKELLENRALFKEDNQVYEKELSDTSNKITELIKSELENISAKPNSVSLDNIKNIIECFNLTKSLEKLKEIAMNYNNYLNSLREKAKGITTINEGNNMLSSLQEVEIEEELKSIITEKLNVIMEAINSVKKSYEELDNIEEVVSSYIQISKRKIVENYDELTIEDFKAIKNDNYNIIDNYKENIKSYVEESYKNVYGSLKPLINNSLITLEDIENCFYSSSKSNDKKVKVYENGS